MDFSTGGMHVNHHEHKEANAWGLAIVANGDWPGLHQDRHQVNCHKSLEGGGGSISRSLLGSSK